MKIKFIKKNYLISILLLAYSLFLTISLLSFNPSDPSANLSSKNEVMNLGGKWGAYIAEPTLQIFGIATIILVIVPFIWAIKLIRQNIVKLWFIKVFCLVISTFALSTLLANITNVAVSWTYHSYGGILGDFILKEINISPYKIYLLLIVSSIFLITFFISSSLSITQWKVGYAIVSKIIIAILYGFHKVLLPFRVLLRRLSRGKVDIGSENKNKLTSSLFINIADNNKEDNNPAVNFKAKKTERLKSSIKKSIAKLEKSNFELPSVSFLKESKIRAKDEINQAILRKNAKDLEQVLNDFGINGRILAIHSGPVVTLYELEPAAGIKSSRIIGLADDIARSMKAVSARIAVIPGRNVIGIELPNEHREVVYLRELFNSKEYRAENIRLPIVLGKDIMANPIIVDLSKMPHLLIAGTTGSGKSVAINTMILSLLYTLSPDECRFIMIDPKMLELSVYDGIPNLLTPVVTEPSKAIIALKWVVKEMENRYRLMSNLGVRNISGYNQRVDESLLKGETLEKTVQTGFDQEGNPIFEKIMMNMDKLPFIVVVVDEMADLMVVAGKEIETSVQRLSQMARAAGIHIIMATQRPSVDVITGVIKANFPTRISFQVTSRIDSRTILGEQGAEQLLGMGDMLYMAGGGRITRVHGPYVDEFEVEKVVNFLKSQGEPEYITAIINEMEQGDTFVDEDEEVDELYQDAIKVIIRDKKASTSYIQRCFKIGYNRAASIIEKMEKEGVVSKANHVGKREILIETIDE